MAKAPAGGGRKDASKKQSSGNGRPQTAEAAPAVPAMSGAVAGGAPAAAVQAAAVAGPADLSAVIGQVVALMMASPAYEFTFLADLKWMILPALSLRQFRVYRDDKQQIVAFAAWAFLSEEVERRLNSGNPRLAPKDWKSGDRLWLVNLLAPMGHGPAVLEDLRNGALAAYRINFHRHTPGGMVAEAVAGRNAPAAA
jgi:cytolysin-activating lysine-acyltransferase